MSDRIAVITYETPYAPCGGIAAVIGRLPAALARASGMPTVVISPYHHRIAATTSLRLERRGVMQVPYGESAVAVELLGRAGDPAWVFLKASDERFFAGLRHPYDVGRTPREISDILRRDALFFGAAVAKALTCLAADAVWTVMLQDWEAATVALSLAGGRRARRLFLTLHNGYDSGPVSEALLDEHHIEAGACPGRGRAGDATVLERALPLIEPPVFTVSGQFARDLREDPLQVEIMAPHLQELLAGRLHGVENGLFADLQVPRDELAAAGRGDYAPLRAWKRIRKTEALDALLALSPTPERPVWGDRAQFARRDAPWFVFAGRDDSRQKGYDVGVLAVERALRKGARAKFLFFPIPGDEGPGGLSFMADAAQRHPQHVLALPFLWKEGFAASLQGAAFGVMPSFYEPFGMANEFYLHGAVGIGRATGGLVQQIVPWRDPDPGGGSVAGLARRWHDRAARPTGFLYREPDSLDSVAADWRRINTATPGGMPAPVERLTERRNLALVRAMAESLQLVMQQALEIHDENPALYHRMLSDGIDHLLRNFNWDRTAGRYLELMGLRVVG